MEGRGEVTLFTHSYSIPQDVMCLPFQVCGHSSVCVCVACMCYMYTCVGGDMIHTFVGSLQMTLCVLFYYSFVFSIGTESH